SLAVREGIKLLRNEEVSPDYREAVLRLSTLMFVGAKRCQTKDEGRRLAERALSSGEALETFRSFLGAQGADPRICDDFDLLPSPEKVEVVRAPHSGYIHTDPRALGNLANSLANGEFGSTSFDSSAGIIICPNARYGSHVEKGTPIAEVYGSARLAPPAAKSILTGPITIQDAPPPTTERFPKEVL
ncbi:MAG: hypothetical protein KDD42_06745, partial [Bdellovibrionales bacterium]|nr:hypothetical protein [Bdellovibrionales bacterium]